MSPNRCDPGGVPAPLHSDHRGWTMMVPVEPVIRLAEQTSAAELAALHREAAHTAFADIFPPEAEPPRYEEDLVQWEYWLGPDRDMGRRAYVAVAEETTLGVVLTGPDPDEPSTGHLGRLYVRPAYWGQGIGTRLYGTAITDLRRRHFPEATLWVLEANTRVRSWYERLGWRLTGERRPVYAPADIDDVQYRVTLSEAGAP